METTSELTQVTMAFLCYRCEEETERFFLHKAHDPRYCYELFRRAIAERDELAWHCLYHRYRKLVGGWAERHQLYGMVNEDTEVLVNAAFEKMWHVITPEKFDRFPDLKSILRYLQMCLSSVIIDMTRSVEKVRHMESVESDLLDERDSTETELAVVEEGPEEQVFYEHEAQALWLVLNERLKNEKERRVIYGMYVLALKPAEVYDRYPTTFRNVREVYLVKDNLLERLRRDGEVRAFYDGSNG